MKNRVYFLTSVGGPYADPATLARLVDPFTFHWILEKELAQKGLEVVDGRWMDPPSRGADEGPVPHWVSGGQAVAERDFSDAAAIVVFRDRKMAERFRSKPVDGVPVFFYGSSAHDDVTDGFHRLAYDEREILSIGLRHLRAAGHRRIGAFYFWQAVIHTFRKKLLEQMAPEFGLDLDRNWTVPIESRAYLREKVGMVDVFFQKIEAVRHSPDRPTAFFSMDDEYLTEVVQVLQRLGWQVPGELAFVGVNDHPFLSFLSPGIDSVAIPIEEDALRTAGLVAKVLEGGPAAPLSERSALRLAKRRSVTP